MWSGVAPPPLIPAHLVLDIGHLNELFRDRLNGLTIHSCRPNMLRNATCVITNGINDGGGFCKLSRKSLPNLGIREFITPFRRSIPIVKDTIMKPPVLNMPHVIIGCPWQLFSNNYEKNMKSMERVKYLSQIKFSKVFYDIVWRHLQTLGGTTKETSFNYTAVHLRMENDFIHHYSIHLGSQIKVYYFLFSFVEFVRRTVNDSNERILLQTGLRSSDDLYFAISYIKLFFPNTIVLDKRILCEELHEPMLKRAPVRAGAISQIEAIFDLVATQGAHRFIGLSESTFSVWSHGLKKYDNTSETKSYLFSRVKKPRIHDLYNFGNSSEYKVMHALSKSQ